MKDIFKSPWISKVNVSSHEDSAREFCGAGSIFSMKLLRFMSKSIKLLVTELVCRCMNILPWPCPSLRMQNAKRV